MCRALDTPMSKCRFLFLEVRCLWAGWRPARASTSISFGTIHDSVCKHCDTCLWSRHFLCTSLREGWAGRASDLLIILLLGQIWSLSGLTSFGFRWIFGGSTHLPSPTSGGRAGVSRKPVENRPKTVRTWPSRLPPGTYPKEVIAGKPKGGPDQKQVRTE